MSERVWNPAAGHEQTPEITVRVRVEVQRPVAHVESEAQQDVRAAATYETWRHQDLELPSDRSKYARRGLPARTGVNDD